MNTATALIQAEEDRMVMLSLDLACFVSGLTHLFPRLEASKHDLKYGFTDRENRLEMVRHLVGVDHSDPHFAKHVKAFIDDADLMCDQPECVVRDVHTL